MRPDAETGGTEELAATGAVGPNSLRISSLTKSEESSPQLGQMNFMGFWSISGVASKAYLAPQEHCNFMTRDRLGFGIQ
jgi:hypothetical protein